MRKLQFLLRATLIFYFSVFQFISLTAQTDTYVKTPNGSRVKAQKYDDGSYNCHGYSWHMYRNEPNGDPVYIDGFTFLAEDEAANYDTLVLAIGHYSRYWKDGSYESVPYDYWPKGGVLRYKAEIDHSAVISENENKWLISKNGINGDLITHYYNALPYPVGENGINIVSCYVRDKDALTAADFWEPPVLDEKPILKGAEIIPFGENRSYDFEDFPSGATTEWSVEPANSCSIVPQTPSTVTITPNYNANSTFTLNAKITKGYYTPIYRTKTIQVQGTTSLNGPNLVCSENTAYTLVNPPLNGTVSWSVSANMLIVSSNNSGIVVKQMGPRGSGTISYSVNGTTVPKNVWVGVPRMPDYMLPYTTNNMYTFAVGETHKHKCMNTTSPGIDYADYWEWACLVGSITMQGSQLVDVTYGPYYGEGPLMVRARNTCGYSRYLTYTVNVLESNPVELYISPNPANDYFEAEIKDKNYVAGEKEDKATINLYSPDFVLVYTNKTSEKKISIATNSLPSGLYLLQIIYKDKKYSKQVLVEH